MSIVCRLSLPMPIGWKACKIHEAFIKSLNIKFDAFAEPEYTTRWHCNINNNPSWVIGDDCRNNRDVHSLNGSQAPGRVAVLCHKLRLILSHLGYNGLQWRCQFHLWRLHCGVCTGIWIGEIENSKKEDRYKRQKTTALSNDEHNVFINNINEWFRRQSLSLGYSFRSAGISVTRLDLEVETEKKVQNFTM